MGELFTVPRCQEFLVTVQSNSGRALRVRLDAFLKADAAKAGHSSLSWRGITAEVSGLVRKWPLSEEVPDLSHFHEPRL